MPDMNGMDFVFNVRKAMPEVPIVMITSNAKKKDVLQALRAGVTDYIITPLAAETLHERITKALAGKSDFRHDAGNFTD